MKLLLGRLLLRLLAWLPLPVVRLLARPVAVLPIDRRGGARTRQHLARAFPDLGPGARATLLRENRRALAATALECGPIWHRPRAWLERRIVAVEGIGHARRGLAHGRGLLVLGGHLGQWELSILYGSLTLPIAYLYKPPRDRRVDAALTRRRERFGARMIPAGGVALRHAVRQLRQGRALGLLFDQFPGGGERVAADFFGRPVATACLPQRLIRTTGCAVVMGHCLRDAARGGWRIVFDPVPGADDPDPVQAATAMNRALEAVIRRAPEQYLWQYRRD